MKKFGKFKLFGFVIILTGALVIVGINYLEGKKPQRWDWIVEIPNLAEAQNEGLNLYGNNPAYDEKDDFIEVDVSRRENIDTGEISYVLRLEIYNTNQADPSLTGTYSIGFRDLVFRGCMVWPDECENCICCNFPTSEDWDYCINLECDGLDSPDYVCLRDFLIYEHGHPSFGYDHFVLTIRVYNDIENSLDPGTQVTADTYMYNLDVWNTKDALEIGDEYFHNVTSRGWLRGTVIERIDENRWAVTVSQELVPFYEGYWKEEKEERGKSGKYFTRSKYYDVLGARTKEEFPFKFRTIWTRYERQGGPNK